MNRKIRSKLFIVGWIVIILLCFFIGLYDSPFSVFNREKDFKVEAEYLTGILSTSGILFGIWAIVLEKKPKTIVWKWFYEHIISKSFIISFVFLVISVVFVSLTALNLLSSIMALIFCTLSFCYNALIIFLVVYMYKFFEKETNRTNPFQTANND